MVGGEVSLFISMIRSLQLTDGISTSEKFTSKLETIFYIYLQTGFYKIILRGAVVCQQINVIKLKTLSPVCSSLNTVNNIK